MTNAVDHPAHYERFRMTFEPADLTMHLPHPLASAIEYILRAPYKGNEREDLEKAFWWLGKLIESEEMWFTCPDPTGKMHKYLEMMNYTAEYSDKLLAAYYAIRIKAPILRTLHLDGTTNIDRFDVMHLRGKIEKMIDEIDEKESKMEPECEDVASHDTALQAGGTE